MRAAGALVSDAHVWVYIPGGDTYTAADGSYALQNIPIGSYALNATAVITTNGASAEYSNGLAGQMITLSAANAPLVEDILLQGLPENYRRIDIQYSISCDHGNANPTNAQGVQTPGPGSQSVFVNAGQVTSGLTYTFDYNSGGYFHIDYAFTVALLEDLSVEVTVIATMKDDGSGDVQEQYTLSPFNVAVSQSCSGWINMEHSNGYHNGPAKFTFSLGNN